MSDSNLDLLTPAAEQLVRVVRATFQLNGMFLRHGDGLFSSAGITSSRVQVIASLREGPCTVPDIARGMGLTRQGVQRTVHGLKKEGLVEVKDNPQHKRSSLIGLTAKGKQRLQQVTVSRNRFLNEWSRMHSTSEVKRMADFLERLHSEVEEQVH